MAEAKSNSHVRQCNIDRNFKILAMESISQAAVDEFVKRGYEVECVHKLSQEDLIKRIPEFHVIGVRSKTKLTKKVLEAAENLLAVGCFCIGTDQTDLEVASELAIPVFNAPYANTRSVAEMCLSNIIALARQIGDRNRECHEGIWNKRSAGCYEIRGKTLGIIGYGHVGSQLSVIAEALGMRVVYYDVVNKLPLGNASPCKSMEELLAESDFVSLHVPSTPETRGLIGAEQVKLMRKGTYLLNAARGSVVDVDVVSAALHDGHLAGAAFDVYPKEPSGAGDKLEVSLRGCPNTILTPHIGGSTEEAQRNIGLEVADKLINYLEDGDTRGSVNMPSVSLSRSSVKNYRITNVHQNVPGVLRNINNILLQYNIAGQLLRTDEKHGFIVVDLDKEASQECLYEIAALPTSVRTRLLR